MTDPSQASYHYQISIPTYEIRMPDDSPPTVEVLHLALADENAEVAVTAALQLAQLGDLSPSVIDTLFNAADWLADPEASSAARHGIVELAKTQPVIIDLLLAALQQENRPLTGVAECLGTIGQARPDVIQGLLAFVRQNQQPDSYAAVSAANSLLQLGYEDAALIDFLLLVRRRGDAFIRSVAVDALGLVQQVTPEMIDVLLTTLQRGRSIVRVSAARSLGRTGLDDPRVVEALLHACQDKEWKVRAAAIQSLGGVTNPSPNGLDVLCNALSDREWFVRMHALECLGKLGTATPTVIDKLLTVLETEEQQQAAYPASPSHTDKQEDNVLAVLEKMKNHQSLYGHIALTLAKVGCVNDAVLTAFRNELKSRDRSVRERAARNWWLLGNHDPAVIQTLQEALQDEDDLVRTSAAGSLKRLQIDAHSE